MTEEEGPKFRTEGGGTYQIPDGDSYISVPGVTTILGAVPKQGGFVGGALKKSYAGLDAMDDRNDWTYEMHRASWYQDHTARDLGSKMHHMFEAKVTGQTPHPKGEAELGHYKAFTDWLTDYEPEFLLTEVTVANLTWGYAGTLDWVARIEGAVTLGDFKTGYLKSPFFEPKLQTSAYAKAEFAITDEGERVELPDIEQIAVLGTSAEGAYSYNVLPFDFESFAAIKHVFHAMGPKKSVCTPACPVCHGEEPK